MSGCAVSIIIPAYNAEEFLQDCLDSISAQTFKDFEAIVVDDGSTDSTAEIASRMALSDSRFRRLRLPENKGLSGARNEGTFAASGRRICYVDADDCLHPQALELMVGAMRREKAGICRSAFSSKKGFLGKVYRKVDEKIYSYPEAVTEALYQRVIMNPAWAMVIEKSIVEEAGFFRERIWYEDIDSFYRFMEKSDRIVYIKQPLYYYRPNPKSFIRNWSDGRLDVLDVTDRMLNFFRERYPKLTKAAEDRRYSAHFNMLLLLLRNGIDNPGAMARCRKVVREGRKRTLTDPNVRLKNKIGALMSYGGIGVLRLLSRHYPGHH